MKKNTYPNMRHITGCLLLALGVLFACLPTAAASDQGWNLAARLGNLTLWVDNGTGNCKVEDIRTKSQWSSAVEGNTKQNEFWSTAYRSAFEVRYLTSDGVKTFYTGGPDCRKTVQKISGGVRCLFSFIDPRLDFSVEYRLFSGDRLQVNIPMKMIKDPQKGLLDIRVLPFFGHLSQDSRGYIVLPDGCGGIINSGHLKSITYFGTRVYNERFFWTVERDRNNQYGSNQRYINFYDYNNPNTMSINLPMFGSVKGESAILGVIEKGADQAQIGPEITPDDFVLGVSSRLIIREITYDMFTRAHASQIFNRSDRSINYYFLAATDASYSGMARRYRSLLLKKIKNHARVHPAFRLRFLFGVERKYKDTRELITVTTFKEAEDILRQLKRSGVRRLDVVLTGWTRRGFLGDEPVHFPPDRRFGGWHGLKRLVRVAERLGYRIGLQIDNTYAWKTSGGFRRFETVKDFQGIAVELGPDTEEYLRCPKPAWDRFFKDDYRRIEELGLNGNLLLSGPDQGLLVCLDDKHPLGSPGAIAVLTKSVDRLGRNHSVSTLGSMGYLFSKADGFWDIPSTSSSACDRSVPLIPMILHGLKGYSFEPINLRQDNRRDFLRMVEYGGIPNAYLTAKTVEDLAEARYNLLFSGKYQDWRGPLRTEYLLYQKKLAGLQSLFIEGHERLASGIYSTRYEQGIEVVVNYTRKPFVYKGVPIKAENYHVFR